MTPERIAELKLAAEGVDAIHEGARMPVEAGELLFLIDLAESYKLAWESACTRADTADQRVAEAREEGYGSGYRAGHLDGAEREGDRQ